MEEKRILAKDARQIADTTRSVLNHIYKAIRETSKEGQTTLSWCVFNTSETLLNSIIRELSEAGYSTKFEYYSDTDENKVPDALEIKW